MVRALVGANDVAQEHVVELKDHAGKRAEGRSVVLGSMPIATRRELALR